MKEEVAKLKAEAEKRFNELTAAGEKARAEVASIEDELKRLQGEYAGYEKLEKVPEPDPATTIKATPKASSGK
jgi:Tfp pilus assembly protein FimV